MVLVAAFLSVVPARATSAAGTAARVTEARFAAALAALPGGGLRYGERLTGRVREIDAGGQLLEAPVTEVSVRADGQRGLLGLAVDAQDRTFAAWTRPDGRIVVGQVAPGPTRLLWVGPQSRDLANGGHLVVDPEGSLVIGIGDLQAHRFVDDPDRPNGKLLRLDPDGAPDQSPITLSAGWNNPFAFTFTPSGALWVADNVGRQGRERLARGDRDGKPTSVTELRGTRAPSGLAAIDDQHLALCGFVSTWLDEFDVSRPRAARPDARPLATDCAIGAVRLADGTIAYADTTTIRTVIAPTGTRAVSAWPAAIAGPRHSGASAAHGPTTAHLRWRRRLEGDVTPGPVVAADGTIYAASNGGVLHALDPATGQDRWTYDGGGGYGSDLSTSPAVLDDGTVLWPGPRDRLFALSPDGALLWFEEFGAMVLSPAVGADGAVYVASQDARLTRLDVGPGTHKRRWSLALGSISYGSAVVGPDGTVYTAADESLVAVDDRGDTAEVKWRFDTGFVIETSPAVGPDGTVVIGPNGHFEYGVTPGGEERWRYDRHELSYSSAAVTDDGVAWFGDHNGYMNAVDVRTGVLIRRVHGLLRTATRKSAGVWTSPAIDADGNVYFGTRPGHVHGFAPSGRQLFDIDTGATVDSYPAITTDGILLIGSADGTLLAVGA